MENRRMAAKLFIAWGVSFLVLFVCIRGIGIFEFQEKRAEISNCIIGMDAVIQEGDNVYIPQGDTSYLIFSFEEISSNGIYGVTLYLNEYVKTGGFRAYFGNDLQYMDEEEAYKVYIKKTNNELTVLTTKKAEYLKLYIDKPIDVRTFDVIVKGTMAPAYVIILLLSLAVSVVYTILNRKKEKSRVRMKQLTQKILTRKNMITAAIIVVEMILLCVIEAACYLGIQGVHLNPLRVIMIGSMLAILTLAFRYREYIYTHFYIFYFFLVLTAGTINVLSPPATLDLSWDDQIHYERANHISRGFHHYENEAEYQLHSRSLELGSMKKDNLTAERRQELSDYIDSIENNPEYDGLRRVRSYYSKLACASYLPAAMGLMIGRGLGMSAIGVLLFGKWINLLCYALIMSYAVYLLKDRGYIIVSFIGIVPPAVFLASSYSYDWWLTSLVILGYALYEHELQEHKAVSLKAMVKVIVVMFLAFLPKPVYFPLLLPLLFTHNDSAKESKIKRNTLITAGVMIVIAVILLIPVLKGRNLNDTRGSLEVDAYSQIRFILSNPLTYTGIMLRFIGDFISPDHHDVMFGFMTAYGQGKLYSVILILITIGAFVDNIHYDNNEKVFIRKKRIMSAAGIFATLVLISTAFYVAYTPVMGNNIDGVQYRYSIPILFPFLYYICRTNVQISEENKGKIALTGSIIMAAVLYYNIYTQCISFY